MPVGGDLIRRYIYSFGVDYTDSDKIFPPTPLTTVQRSDIWPFFFAALFGKRRFLGLGAPTNCYNYLTRNKIEL